MRELSTAPKSAIDASMSISWRDYAQLTKPTISLLVVVTSVPSMLMAAGGLPHPLVFLATLLGTWLASASAAVFNHLVEHETDEMMMRTRWRPLPSRKVSQLGAFGFGTVIGVASFVILYTLTTPLAAWLAVAANAYYVILYTMLLKRRTVQNIVIGGAAGAVGPLIGWAAINGELTTTAWLLFAIIFLWTPPHFWALALKYKDDYARAGIPMLPVVKGDGATRLQMFLYTLTLPAGVAWLVALGEVGAFFAAVAMIASLYFAWLCFRLFREGSNRLSMPTFHYSCLYLFLVFGALTIDQLVMQLL